MPHASTTGRPLKLHTHTVMKNENEETKDEERNVMGLMLVGANS